VEEKILALGFTALGLLFAGTSMATVLRTRRFFARAYRAPGVVTGLRRADIVKSGTSVRVYYPRLAFRTYDGRDIDTESGFGSSPPPAHPGDSITVLYDPQDPEKARVAGVRGCGGCFAWVFAVVGLLFAAVGIGTTIAVF